MTVTLHRSLQATLALQGVGVIVAWGLVDADFAAGFLASGALSLGSLGAGAWLLDRALAGGGAAGAALQAKLLAVGAVYYALLTHFEPLAVVLGTTTLPGGLAWTALAAVRLSRRTA